MGGWIKVKSSAFAPKKRCVSAQVGLGSGMRPTWMPPLQTCLWVLSELPSTLSVQKGLGGTQVFTPIPQSERWRSSAWHGDSPASWSALLEWRPGSRTASGLSSDARAHPSLRTFSPLQDPTDVLGLSGLGTDTGCCHAEAERHPQQSSHGCSGTSSRNLGLQHVNSVPSTTP